MALLSFIVYFLSLLEVRHNDYDTYNTLINTMLLLFSIYLFRLRMYSR